MKIETTDMIAALSRDLNEKIKYNEQKVKKIKIKLGMNNFLTKEEKETTKKLNFLDSLIAKRDLKKYQEKYDDLKNLDKIVSDLMFYDLTSIKIPEKFKESLSQLYFFLSEEERKNLKRIVSDSFKTINNEEINKIKLSVEKAKKIIEKYNLNIINDDIYKNNLIYNNVLIDAKEEAIFELKEHILLFEDTSKIKTESNIDIEMKKDSIDFMYNTFMKRKSYIKELQKDKNCIKFSQEAHIIKQKIEEKYRIEKSLSEINYILISDLFKVEKADFSKLDKYLKNLKQKLEKELKMIEDYLKQFDLESLKNKIGKIDENDKYLMLNSNIKTKNVDKEKNKSTNMNESIGFGSGFKKSDNNELEILMNIIRDYAISQLKDNGAFKEIEEIHYDNASDESIAREELIQRKIKQLLKFADMSPIDRGLEELKEEGSIAPNATVKDLSQSQINKINTGYRDESYPFMSLYNKLKKKDREELKKEEFQANTIYKEYIRYRISLKNKNEYIKFSEFAKQYFDFKEMNENMVDTKLIDEMKEKSR